MKKYVFCLVSLMATLTVGSLFAADPLPTVNLSASPLVIPRGATTMISWNSLNAGNCLLSRASTGATLSYLLIPLNGSLRFAPSQTTTYGLSCTGTGGSNYTSKTVTVIYPLPTVNLTASPSTLTGGNYTNISWNAINAYSCSLLQTASGGATTSLYVPLSGSGWYAPSQTTTYGLSCTGTGGSNYTSKTVTVI